MDCVKRVNVNGLCEESEGRVCVEIDMGCV